jgi:hypothetical protein
MSDRGSFSIWKDDPALDSWYNAAVNRNFSLRNDDGNPMEEMSFFDIAKPNQVNHPSGAANEWFYDATLGDNTIKESKFNFCKLSPVVYLTWFSACSFTHIEYSWIDAAWAQVQQSHHRQTSAISSRFSDSLCSEGQC